MMSTDTVLKPPLSKVSENALKKSNCLVKFMVDNYTPKDKDIGLSECIITLYRGSS